MKTTSVIAALATLCLFGDMQAQTPAVPSQYQDAYNDVNTSLTNFEATITSTWDGSPYPVLHSTNLQTASSDLTTSLLAPNYYQAGVLAELNDLQSLGTSAVTIQINFPALYAPYYSDPSQYQAFLAFYTQLVSDVHARGLKLIVENTSSVPYPGNNSATFTSYLQGLDWPTYQAQRAQMAATIAQSIQPDYLVLLEEPDTEASVSGQPNVNTVPGATQMLQGMISAIQATGVTNVQLAAGAGTWNPSFLQFVQSFATLPIPYIDMHIYPVNQSNLPNALTAVGMIQAAGKQATISEMWDYKESDTDYNSNIPYTTVFARDVYSFWGSTDMAFLKTMSDFTNYGHFAFSSPFWSHYYSAYLDYNTYGGQPDATVITTENTAASQAISIGAFTSTGNGFESMLIASPDQTPPMVPAPPAIQGFSQTAATINWMPTTDNVGVAAYNIYRNGALVATVNSPQIFADTTLSAATTYTYTIQAFDASGNLSPMSAPLTFTTLSYPDTTAPSTPAGLQATPLSDTQMSLNWKASTDNVGVQGYEIYRGTSTSNITPYSTSPTNSFVDTYGAPKGTYYYQIDAYDAAGNHSARSPIVTATFLPDTTPPTAPGNVTLTTAAGPSVTISWSASTDDYAVASYEVFRGTTASNLALYAAVAPSTLTFTDTHVTSGATYYYAVTALDPAKNMSAMPAAVFIIAYPDTVPPSVPTNLQVTPVSLTQLNLIWTPSTDNVAVAGYDVYRGTSASNIALLTTSATNSFTDSWAAPGTTYYYQIDAYDAAKNHSAASAVVIATSLPDTTPPTAPHNLSVTTAAGPSVTVTWTASTDNYAVASYDVFRGTTASNLALYATLAASTLTFTDTHVTSGATYYYTVAALDPAKNMSAMPAAVSIIAYPDTVPPTVPTNLRATPVSMTQINLSWTASTDNVAVAGYDIYRGTSASNIALFTTSATNSFTDSWATPGTTYYYQIDAYDAAKNHSAASAVVIATSLPDTTPPTAPHNLSVTTAAGPSVTVTWTASTDNYAVASYDVFRGTTASNLALYATLAASTLTFTDTHVTSGATYYYTVAALDPAKNMSAMPAAVSIIAYPDTVPPTVPTNLRATPVSMTQINLSWTASTDNVAVAGYDIYRGTSASNIALFTTSATSSFTDSWVTPGTTYYYQIDAYDAVKNHSATSAVVTATSLPDTTPPSTPAGFSAVSVSGPAVTLSWGASSDNYKVVSYQIYRGTTPSNLALYAGQAAAVLSYSDAKVSSGKTYYYSVTATDFSGNVSGMSPQASVTLP